MAALLALAAAGPAAAQQSNSPIAQGLLDLPANDRPPAERFQTPDGRVRFLLDRSGARLALVRFEGSDEVHVLRLVPGPRGDEIYKTDTNDMLLRVTPQGGVTVYVDANRLGAPATLAGRAQPVAPLQAPPGGLRAAVAAAERDAARRLGRPVTIEAPEAQGAAAGVVADAAARAAQGLGEAQTPMRVQKVTIRIGAAPAVQAANDQVTITVAPQMGYAGRPSSAAVRRAVTGTVVEVAGN
jgi:hypothetical protein